MLKVMWLKDYNNFGDVLTPFILNHYGVPHIYKKNDYNAIMIGSIAKFAMTGTHILGAGFMNHNDPVCKEAAWHWVRGPLSAEKVTKATGQTPKLLGDAAALLPLMWPAPPQKKHKLGIVPHHIDFAHTPRTAAPIVDLTQQAQHVTAAIAECERVITSSLHGLIVAHAYGIPAALVKFGNRLKGDGFKFEDYFASVGLAARFSTFDNPVFTLPTNPLQTQPMKEILQCFR